MENHLKEKLEVGIQKWIFRNQGFAFRFANSGVGLERCLMEDYLTCQNQMYLIWDLNMLPRPMIYNNEMVLDNLREETLEEIYNGDTYKIFVNRMRSSDLQGDSAARIAISDRSLLQKARVYSVETQLYSAPVGVHFAEKMIL